MTDNKKTEAETDSRTAEAEIDKASLLALTLQLADMVLITAPAFAEGSQGARVVDLARTFRPKLADMFEAERKKRTS